MGNKRHIRKIKKIDSKIVYSNPWMEVREEKVQFPKGNEGIYSTVKYKAGVAILPLDNNGNVYLIREFKYALGNFSLEVACGGIEENQNPLMAAKLELKQELGIIAKRWKSYGYVLERPTQVACPHYLFLAQELTIGNQALDYNESIERIKIPLEEAIKMAFEKKISHHPSHSLLMDVYYDLSCNGKL